MTYKELLNGSDRVWIEVGKRRRDSIGLMKWLKNLGCVWLNGTKINPYSRVGPYLSVHSDGKIAYVNMWSWIAWHRKPESERTKVIGVEQVRQLIKGFIPNKEVYCMKDFWQKVFEQTQKQLVFFMEIAGKHEYGTEYVILAMDHTFETCAVFDDFGEISPRPMDRGFVKLAFKCDYDYDYPAVFENEAELEAQGLKKCPISVVMGQDENGNSAPIPTAVLCGKITAIKELGGAHIFEVEYGDKIFPVVFFQERPNADVGDILYGEFDVLACFSHAAEK